MIPKRVENIKLAHPGQAMIFLSTLNNISLDVLGDTGASANVTSRSIALRTNSKIYNLDKPIPIEYANGTKGEVSEYCCLKLTINSYKINLPCYITEDVGNLVIMGIPLFMLHKVSIDWKNANG
jgi:hypothetical protein